MEVTQFYLHLPSNSSLDKFPNNTLTEYRVGLPQTINLTGEWEVALTESHYPRSWNNVQDFRFFVRNEKLHGMWDTLPPPSAPPPASSVAAPSAPPVPPSESAALLSVHLAEDDAMDADYVPSEYPASVSNEDIADSESAPSPRFTALVPSTAAVTLENSFSGLPSQPAPLIGAQCSRRYDYYEEDVASFGFILGGPTLGAVIVVDSISGRRARFDTGPRTSLIMADDISFESLRLDSYTQNSFIRPAIYAPTVAASIPPDVPPVVSWDPLPPST